MHSPAGPSYKRRSTISCKAKAAWKAATKEAAIPSFGRSFLHFGRLDTEKISFDGGSCEAYENCEAPVVDCLRYKHVSRRLQETPSVSEQTHVQEKAYQLAYPKVLTFS